ncbi:MAG: MGDG synthase family glycosyltransferase [Christensenellales bacterium]|jgi:processive 1,2-diacylglycerol beta-glucosyltransferase
MKKIMIVTVTAGEGHNSIAKAIKSLLEQNPNNKVKVIDLFKKYSPLLKQKVINEGYMAACKYAMPIYNMFYRAFQKTDPEKRNKVAAQSTILKESAGLLQDIYLFEPDVIICTHFFGSIIISNLRKIYPIPAKTISIVTDYAVHPFWEASIGIDKVISPTELMYEDLIYKGFKPEQIITIGLPVKKEFSEYFSKSQAREELGLAQNMFTVLLMFGGGGFGQNVKIFKKLLKVKRPLQIVVVNGKDTQSKKKIDSLLKAAKTKHKVFNYGFIDFVSKVMSAADILVGKAGGISVTESLNKGIPMLLPVNLAEQEKANMKFLVQSGAALNYSTKKPLQKTLTDLYDNNYKLEELKQGALKVRKPNAIFEVGNLVETAENVVYTKAEPLNKTEASQLVKQIKKMLANSDKQLEKLAIKKAEKSNRKMAKPPKAEKKIKAKKPKAEKKIKANK